MHILFYITIISVVWYCIVIYILCKGLLLIKVAEGSNGNRFSVVIAARNEENTILDCLTSIYNQTIREDIFEVIVVDDRSTDNTSAIVKSYQKKHTNLSLYAVSSVPSYVSPKKHAVSKGVEKAKNSIIVFTDADCIVPKTWLETIDRHFSNDVGLVQGITKYHYTTKMNILFFGLQAVDFISHGIIAAAAIGAHLPLNSNANNFAFRKEAFEKTGGVISKIGHIVSGDDDLLLQKIWREKKWKIRFMIENTGTVTTMPTKTISLLFQQRARWGSKTIYYNKIQVILLTGIFIFYCAIILNIAILPWWRSQLWLCVQLMVIKFLGEIMIMIPGLIRFRQKKLIPLLPIASVLQLPLVVSAVVIGIFGKFNWKDQTFSRTVK